MKSVLRLAVFVIILGLVFWLVARSMHSTVVVSAARTGTAVDAVPGNLTVSAPVQMNVRAEADGIVREVIKPPNSESRRVNRGDPIVVLDTTEIDFDIASFEIEVNEGQRLLEMESHYAPQIDDLRDELADQEILLQAGKIALVTVERTRRALLRHEILRDRETISQERALARNQVALDRLRFRREKMTIRSPIDGTLDATFVFTGDYIRINHNVALIVAPGRHITVDVSEEDIAGIEPGQPVQARILAYGNRLYQGKVGYLAHTANVDTKRRGVSVNLEIERELLVPGLTGQATIIKGERENAVLVPRRALVGHELFVVDNGRIEVRTVRIGFLSAGQAEILEGIAAGEFVVVETPHIHRSGDRVGIASIVPF